jgi:hypothetical protein
MGRLGIAVLMTARRVRGLGRHAVVRHERSVIGRELLWVGIVIHCQRHAVGPMALRYGAQIPHRILPTDAQACETLGKAHRYVFPVRVRQDKVINQMVEAHTLDGHLQVVHPGKVRSRQTTGGMLLGKEHFFGRSMLGLPLTNPAFQRASHRGRILPRMRLLQPIPKGLGHQGWRALQQGHQFGPDFCQRIGPRPPGMRLVCLAGKGLSGPIFASGFAIHVGLQRCLPQRSSFV